jgi:hypothetical protein
MAYADGELAPEARATFEARLVVEPSLRRLVVDQQEISVLARDATPPEPLELERLRVERDVPQAVLQGIGRLFLVLGILYAFASLTLSACDASWRLPFVGAGVILCVGFAALLLRAQRIRRATLHLDPYRNVQR